MTATSTTNPLTDAAQPTDLTYSFNVTDPDQALNITVPDGCENALQMPNLGLPSQNTSDSNGSQTDDDFPTYPGSSLVANVAGIQTFMIRRAPLMRLRSRHGISLYSRLLIWGIHSLRR